MGFPGGTVVNNSPAKAGDADDAGSIPGLGRSYGGKPGIPPVFSPGDHGQRSLAVYSPWSHKELDMIEFTHRHTHTHS